MKIQDRPDYMKKLYQIHIFFKGSFNEFLKCTVNHNINGNYKYIFKM